MTTTSDAPGTATPRRARHTPAAGGDAWWFFDTLMVERDDGSEGGPVVIEATVAPGGGAPTHVHEGLDDSFYLVSGRLAVRCGDDAFTVDAGGYVTMPHGVPHTFRVVGDQPAVMLQVHGDDSFLRFVRTVGRPAPARGLPDDGVATDLDAAFAVAAETGQPVIGPPLSDEEVDAIVAAAG